MITDKEQISLAVSALLRSTDMAFPLREEAFHEVCPEPEWAVHILERSVSKACAALTSALADGNIGFSRGLVLFVRSDILTMGDLERMDLTLPQSPCFVRGMDFRHPAGGNVEMWVFGNFPASLPYIEA